MSKKGFRNGLLDILHELGLPIDKTAYAAVKQERKADPGATTEDIILRLDLAPPEAVSKAVTLARHRGSAELLADRYQEAAEAVRAQRRTSIAAGDLAHAISTKGEEPAR